jgi:hypothetical protein
MVRSVLLALGLLVVLVAHASQAIALHVSPLDRHLADLRSMLDLVEHDLKERSSHPLRSARLLNEGRQLQGACPVRGEACSRGTGAPNPTNPANILPCVATDVSPLDECLVTDWASGSGYCGKLPAEAQKFHNACSDGSACQSRQPFMNSRSWLSTLAGLIPSAFGRPGWDPRTAFPLNCSNSQCSLTGDSSWSLKSRGSFGDPCLVDQDCGPATSDKSVSCELTTRTCSRAAISDTCFPGQCEYGYYCGDSITKMPVNDTEGTCLAKQAAGAFCQLAEDMDEMCTTNSFCDPVGLVCTVLNSLPNDASVPATLAALDLPELPDFSAPMVYSSYGLQLCQSKLLIPVVDEVGNIVAAVCTDPASVQGDSNSIGTSCGCKSTNTPYPIPNTTLWCIPSGSQGSTTTCTVYQYFASSAIGRSSYNDLKQCAANSLQLNPAWARDRCAKADGELNIYGGFPTCTSLACPHESLTFTYYTLRSSFAAAVPMLLTSLKQLSVEVPKCLETALTTFTSMSGDVLERMLAEEVNSYCQLPSELRSAQWSCVGTIAPLESPTPSPSAPVQVTPSSSASPTVLREETTSIGFASTAIVVAVIASCIAYYRMRARPGSLHTPSTL